MSENKTHGQHEIGDISDLVDHISSLPDCILHHILSFMPTKEAVKTSILSRRWKNENLWVFASKIDFDDDLLFSREVHGWHLPDVTSFVNLVERFFQLRNALNLEKFRLTCRGCYHESRIHSWISNAIMHNVQELDLTFRSAGRSMIPWSMLYRTSLVTLKIRMSCITELPSHFSFPCLKTFHLASIRFLNDDCTEETFLGCPVLRELVLLDCKWMSSQNIAISSSTLKSLTINDLLSFNPSYDSMISIFNPSYDPIGFIKIDATNLTYFEYSGYLSNEILFNNASSLVKACIHIPPSEWKNRVACRVVDLLKRLQHVVSLSVSNPTIESLMFVDNMRARFPMFLKFSHLVLTMEIGNNAFGAVMDFLYSCPLLQSICIYEGFKHRMRLGENDPIWLSLPTCVSNCLKTMTFKNFHAYDLEICFVKCVLKYACVLERMDIWWFDTELQDPKKTEVKAELEMISTAYVIKFS
ncbi:hypothetical protein LXL04_037445 [Taraxacum kok-saghyz]